MTRSPQLAPAIALALLAGACASDLDTGITLVDRLDTGITFVDFDAAPGPDLAARADDASAAPDQAASADQGATEDDGPRPLPDAATNGTPGGTAPYRLLTD